MEESKWLEVGKIRDAHGLKGEVFIVPFSEDSDWIEKSEGLRIVLKTKNDDGEWEETVHDYTISRKKPHKVGYIVKFEELKNRNESEALKGARIHVNKEILTSSKGGEVYLQEVDGFAVFDQGDAYIGDVDGFSSNGPQDLLIVKSESGKNFEIPFIKEFTQSINWEEKQIHMNLPEGLIE